MNTSRILRRQGGFAYIAAIILLVLMAGMAAAIVRLNVTQANAAAGAALTARASQAARAGLEWSFYQLRTKSTAGCADAVLTDFQKDTGFLVRIKCNYKDYTYNEGQNADGSVGVKYLYRVEAIACNGGGADCPDAAGSTQADYTERRRVATVCMLAQKDASGEDGCY